MSLNQQKINFFLTPGRSVRLVNWFPKKVFLAIKIETSF